MKTYIVTPNKNRLGETVLMRGHNICFNGEILKIILKLYLLLLLIWSPELMLPMKVLIRIGIGAGFPQHVKFG